MAKRISRSQSEANESSSAATPESTRTPGAPAQPPKSRRSRAGGTAKARGAASTRDAAEADETFAARAGAEGIAAADASGDDRRSVSMGSEPSDQDIRLRAYQRYLERGAHDGRHFEDWLEAERELREQR